MKKEKNIECTFKVFGFLEGKMFTNNKEKIIFIPNITSMVIEDTKVMSKFDANNGIVFKRDEKDNTVYNAYEFIGKERYFYNSNKTGEKNEKKRK